MAGIAITSAVFEAIAATLPLGSVMFENEATTTGGAVHLA
jgi:hypothetical protein